MLDKIIHFSIRNKLIVGLSTLGLIVWGEESLPMNPILSFARTKGMHLHFLDRESYRQKTSSTQLEKRCGFRMGTQDVFLNMAGGIRVEDPAIDLAICLSIISSMEEIAISDKFCFAAEIGLGGELRAVNRVEQRISEAQKLGFEKIYISKFNKISDGASQKIQINSFGNLKEVLENLFG